MALNSQGNDAYDRSDWANAASYYTQALQKAPSDPVIRTSLGNAQGYMGMDAFNRQDWSAALQLFRTSVQNNPNNAVIAQWLQAAQERYQAAQADAQKRYQAAQEEKRVQQQNNAAAQGVQQVMRDFAQTLDGTSDLTRIGSTSAKQSVKSSNTNTNVSSDAGMQFMSPGSAVRAAATVSTNTAVIAPAQPNGQAPASKAPASAGQKAQDLQFMQLGGVGEVHDAPASVKTPPSSVQAAASAAAAQPVLPGGMTVANLQPLPAMGQPAAPLNTNFDGNGPAANGGNGDDLKFKRDNVAVSTQTATGLAQPPAQEAEHTPTQPTALPIVQPQPKTPNLPAQIALNTADTTDVGLHAANKVVAPLLRPPDLIDQRPVVEPPPAAEKADFQKLFDDPRYEDYEFKEALVDSDLEFGTLTVEDVRMKAEADEFLANWTQWTLYAFENNRPKELLELRQNSDAIAVAYNQIEAQQQVSILVAHQRTVAAMDALMHKLKDEGIYKPEASIADKVQDPRLVQAIGQATAKLLPEENQAIRDAETRARKELLEAGHQIITLGKPWSIKQGQ
jgi:hypothetical protein